MSVYVAHRDVLTVAGADAEAYLQGQISQDLDALDEGQSAWSLVLQPQGKVDALFRLHRVASDRFLLDVDAGHGEALLARLQRFLLRMDVSLELASWHWHAYRGRAPSHLSDGDRPAPIVDPVVWAGEPGLDVVGPELGEPEGGIERLDEAAFVRLRIEAGEPAMGAELDETTIPAEAGDVHRWASFTKGCYTGQELVARIDSRGSNTPRSLHRFRGTGTPPDPGAGVERDGAAVGTLTSVAPAEDGWVALGYLKRGADPAGPAHVGDRAVSIERIAGAT